ncbi:hypothetical protein [Streptomyces sp. NRRL F-5755]|uniref:hypothetical protein n=1 Tax=Streptomyces sp. NRRL F-5755 TaxID=1519475 RepID=UPI000AF125DA|nr:hypothetical protein [Streptomyces sp. NRRL F-5755]
MTERFPTLAERAAQKTVLGTLTMPVLICGSRTVRFFAGQECIKSDLWASCHPSGCHHAVYAALEQRQLPSGGRQNRSQ